MNHMFTIYLIVIFHCGADLLQGMNWLYNQRKPAELLCGQQLPVDRHSPTVAKVGLLFCEHGWDDRRSHPLRDDRRSLDLRQKLDVRICGGTSFDGEVESVTKQQ